MNPKLIKSLGITVAILLLSFSPSHASKKKMHLDVGQLAHLKISSTLGSVDEIWIPKDTQGLQIKPKEEAQDEPSKTEPSPSKDHKGLSPKIVIYIRDAHCIYEAQLHIAKIIESLVRRYGIQLVCLEGSVDKVDPSILLQYTSPLVRQKVLEKFLQQGRLTGVEYASTALESPIVIYGIEDLALYDKNVSAFKTIAPHREKLSRVFSLFEHQLQDLEPYIFKGEMKNLRIKVRQYEAKEIPLNTYVNNLVAFYQKMSGKEGDFQNLAVQFPNIALFLDKESREKEIAFEKVEQERAQFIGEETGRLKGDELNDLISKSLQFRLGQISALEYYTYLKGILKRDFESEMNQSGFKYTNLVKFITYEEIFNRIRAKELFAELDQLRDGLYEGLARTSEEKAFLNYSKNLKILRRLLLSELTAGELTNYLSHKDQINLSGIIRFFESKCKKYKIRLRDGFKLIHEEELSRLVPAAEDFYNYAEQRNGILVQNIFEKMDQENEHVAIVVIGGFHTDALKKAFQEKGVAYAVITPNIQGIVKNNPYIGVITGEKNPLERFSIDFKVKRTQERGGLSQ